MSVKTVVARNNKSGCGEFCISPWINIIIIESNFDPHAELARTTERFAIMQFNAFAHSERERLNIEKII